MKYFKLLLFNLFIVISFISVAQNNNTVFDFNKRSEAYFSFQIDSPKELLTLSNMVSIDKVSENTVYAYANEREFIQLLNSGYSVDIQTAPSMLEKAAMKNWDEIQNQKDDWNYYPTYEAYVSMMNQFATDYPNLCQTVNIGTTNQNRELLFCKISSNVSTDEMEPQVLYTSSMHGDEVTGYVLMLRFIDYLLSHYGTDSEITDLLDHLEIWICPLANPDGTFHEGNNSVNGATRANALGVDLNRNYKDFIYGDHPDDESWQIETVAFMDFQAQHHFVLGFNVHGGSEVLNYPWDNHSTPHADDAWWQFVCREYVDTVHLFSSNNYMTELNNGITNGYAWYQITGSRQDYTNYYDGNREFTLEISVNKTPNASNLPTFWDYNYRSFINLLKQANYGIQGVITDAETQQPLGATVFVENHDDLYSQVTSQGTNGSYYRPIKGGTYDVTYSAYGYHPQTFTLSVNDRETITKNVALNQGTLIANFSSDKTDISENEIILFTDLSFGEPTSWEWTFVGGNPVVSNEQNPSVTYSMEGAYDVMLVITKTVAKEVITDTIIKHHYITVANQFLMQNGSFTTCSGLFLDDGGLNYNYTDQKNYQMTFYPADPTAKVAVDFLNFATESGYDFLKIYDAATNSSSAIIGTYSGSDSPETVVATNTEGALTFVFSSDWNTNDIGWEAVISCQGGSVETPVADFSADATDIEVGESVRFSDLSTNNPAMWMWIFDGGTPVSSSEQNPEITYLTAGIYNVSLTVSNVAGNDTETKEAFIIVHEPQMPPEADFTADKTIINMGESVQFTDLSYNIPTSWQWTFEGGTPATSTEKNPTVTYETEGVFSVELIVANENGSDTEIKNNFITVNNVSIDEAQIEQQISIYPNPTAANAIIQSKKIIQKIEVYNTLGQLLQEVSLNGNIYKLTTNNMNSGIYLIRVYIDDMFVAKRLIIKK